MKRRLPRQSIYAKTGLLTIFYVYIIKSLSIPDKFYVYTLDVQERLIKHNEAGSIYTKKYRPWELVTYFSFYNKSKALAFEAYLKTHSGRAFMKKRLI